MKGIANGLPHSTPPWCQSGFKLVRPLRDFSLLVPVSTLLFYDCYHVLSHVHSVVLIKDFPSSAFRSEDRLVVLEIEWHLSVPLWEAIIHSSN